MKIDKATKIAIVLGGVWGIISLLGMMGGMIEVSGKQSPVLGSWGLDSIIFLPATIVWQLTFILPESVGMAIFLLLLIPVLGAIIAVGVQKAIQRLRK